MVGYVLVLLAGIFFCGQNLIVRVLFNDYNLFGLFHTGGFMAPTLASSFLLLFMRMALGVPLMALLLPWCTPPCGGIFVAWGNRPSGRNCGWRWGVGGVMFLYLALLYVAIGRIAAGIALTLFFTFPVFTALMSWYWFGSRPSPLGWGIMGLILVGSGLTIPMTGAAVESWLGVGFGLASGMAYALYTVVAQQVFTTFHPIPFTAISFAATLVLSGASLVIWPGDLGGLPWGALWVAGLLSAIATATGHVLNNLGIRIVGATAASMLGAANPALTALLAWVGLQEQLSPTQGVGVLVVTLSVALLSFSKSA
ncbi:MAG: EamA family transporter [Leptolyngbyaceae cyanobacterium SM2_3_12]|nr:EamA family transporter [Leptolyngbyaceae cyanobacterium SM2_3_12]